MNVREEDWANNWKQYFKPIEIGYQPTKNYSEQSLEGDKDAKRYLDAENMTGAAVYEDVAGSGYYKYLTPSIFLVKL